MSDKKSNILRVDCSMRKHASMSRILADRLVGQLVRQNYDPEITVRDLQNGIGHITNSWRESHLRDRKDRSSVDRALLAQSEAVTSELLRADLLLFALPIYNFNVPATFKAWIDLICRDNVDGASASDYSKRERNKRAVVILTSNYTLTGTSDDFVTPYLQFILGFIGAHEIDFINATGLGKDRDTVIGSAHAAIDQICDKILNDSISAAAQ